MQETTLKLTLELPYDARLASMLAIATGAAIERWKAEDEEPEPEGDASTDEPVAETPAAEAAPEPKPEPEPEAAPAPAPKEAPKRAARARKAPEPDNAAASLEEAAKAAETAPKPEPAAPQVTGVSMNDLRKEAVRLAQNQKQTELRAVLEKYGAAAVSKIPTERYEEVLADLKAVKTGSEGGEA